MCEQVRLSAHVLVRREGPFSRIRGAPTAPANSEGNTCTKVANRPRESIQVPRDSDESINRPAVKSALLEQPTQRTVSLLLFSLKIIVLKREIYKE